MQQVDQELERLPDDGVGTLAFDVHNEPHTTGVFLVARVVESLGGGATRFEIHKEGLVIGYTSP